MEMAYLIFIFLTLVKFKKLLALVFFSFLTLVKGNENYLPPKPKKWKWLTLLKFF
jgi:hypothetical protein